MSRSREWMLGILFIFVSISITLLLGELAVRIASKHTSIYSIEMVKYALELKMPDPKGLVSHVHRPNTHAELQGVDVSLNSVGDRGPDLPVAKSALKKRVLFLGNSITLGWGVPYESVFSSLLEKKLNGAIEVANAGVGNYGTTFELELLKRRFPLLHPDKVVLQYFIPDIERRSLRANNPIFKYSYLATYLFDRFYNLIYFLPSTINHSDTFFSHYQNLYSQESSDWLRTQNEIQEMKDFLKAQGVPFLIMIVPESRALGSRYRYDELYSEIEKRFRAMEIPTLNAFPVFQRRYGENPGVLWVHRDDPHYNSIGHELMAEILLPYFQDGKLSLHAF